MRREIAAALFVVVASPALVLAVSGCPQQSQPVVPDAPFDGGCTVDNAVSQARLIRNPETGAPMIYPCDGGAE